MKDLVSRLLKEPANMSLMVFILAVLTIFLLTYVPLFGLLAILITSSLVSMVTLHKGARDGFSVLLAVLLPSCTGWLFLGFPAAFFVALLATLVYFFMATFVRLKSWTVVVELMLLLGVVFLLILHWFVPNLTSIWFALFAKINLKSKIMAREGATMLSAEQLKSMLSHLASMLTGISICMVLVYSMLSMILSVSLAKRMNVSLLADERLTGIRLGNVTLFMLLVVLVMYLLHSPLALTSLIMVIYGLTVGGSSVLIYFIEDLPSGQALQAIYFLSFIFLTWIVLLVASLLGFFDMAFNLRKRFSHFKKLS